MADPTPDPTTTLAAWRAVTEGGTEGTWAYTDTGAVYSPEVEADVAQVYWVEDAAFIATARDAMPRLLVFAEAVLALAEGWDDLPCAHGYRLPDGNDTESQCVSCAALDLRDALAEHLGGEGL